VVPSILVQWGLVMRAWALFGFGVSVSMGACGGSTSDGKQPDPDQLIQDACDQIVSLQCPGGVTLAQCDASLHEQRDDAVKAGCSGQFDRAVACVAERLTQCAQKAQEICGPEIQALDDCEHASGGDDCSMGSGGSPPGAPADYQSCGVSCPTWGVECETDASGLLVCTCTAGAKTGTTFLAESCSGVSSSVGAEHCAG
jgi:hypothetical protein